MTESVWIITDAESDIDDGPARTTPATPAGVPAAIPPCRRTVETSMAQPLPANERCFLPSSTLPAFIDLFLELPNGFDNGLPLGHFAEDHPGHGRVVSAQLGIHFWQRRQSKCPRMGCGQIQIAAVEKHPGVTCAVPAPGRDRVPHAGRRHCAADGRCRNSGGRRVVLGDAVHRAVQTSDADREESPPCPRTSVRHQWSQRWSRSVSDSAHPLPGRV